jgi:hypothetical protein
MQDPPKTTQIWILGLKVFHLATLAGNGVTEPRKNMSVFKRQSPPSKKKFPISILETFLLPENFPFIASANFTFVADWEKIAIFCQPPK